MYVCDFSPWGKKQGIQEVLRSLKASSGQPGLYEACQDRVRKRGEGSASSISVCIPIRVLRALVIAYCTVSYLKLALPLRFCHMTLLTWCQKFYLFIFVYLSIYWDRILSSPSWPQTHCRVKGDPKPPTFLSPLPKCQDYRCTTAHLAYFRVPSFCIFPGWFWDTGRRSQLSCHVDT